VTSTQACQLGRDSANGISPQSFPASDVHAIVRHMFMGTEIDNGANCNRAAPVFVPPASWNSVLSQRLQVNERKNSDKKKCDIPISFSIEIVLSNS
jgi:hypothetical protein